MKRPVPILLAAALASAGCAGQRDVPTAEDFAPHGRFSPLSSRERALAECRLELADPGRQSVLGESRGTLRQIPPPLTTPPRYATMAACMDAKGYREAAPQR